MIDTATEMEGAALVAAIVSASHRMTEHSLSSLLESERHRALTLAGALVRLFDVIDALPDTILTVAMERALRVGSVHYADAKDGLEGRWYRLPGDSAPGEWS